MTEREILDHLIRSFRAFNALVAKLELIAQNDEFRGVWALHQIHGGLYKGPTWEPELTEAKECLMVNVPQRTSDDTQEEQNHQDDQDKPEDSTRTVTPATAPTPVGKGADEEQNQNDNQDRG